MPKRLIHFLDTKKIHTNSVAFFDNRFSLSTKEYTVSSVVNQKGTRQNR